MSGTEELLAGMAKALANRETTRAWLETLGPGDLERAWEACPDARALMRLAAMATKPESASGTGRASLTRVCCACARFALERKKGHHRVREAVKKLDQWSSGACGRADVDHALGRLEDDEGDLADALRAIATDRPEDAIAALALALSNDDTVYASGTNAPPPKTRLKALAQLADVVRAHLPRPATEALTSPTA